MADVDTSSYPKAALPVSPLDLAGKIGGLQQQKLAIDQAKLDQANQGLTYMTRAMGALGPDAPKEAYINAAADAVKLGLVPENQLQVFAQKAAAAPDSKSFYNEFMTTAASHQQQIDYHLGRREDVGNGQTVTPAVSSVKPNFGVRPIGMPVQQQVPPTAQAVGPSGQAQMVGAQPPQLAPGTVAGPTPLPVERPPMAAPGPVTNPAILGQSSNFGGRVTGANIEPATFAQRTDAAFPKPTGFATGTTPLFEEGKKALTEDQTLAAARMQGVKPAIQALKLMPGLRTGPGTGQFNDLVATAKAWGVVDTKAENDPTVLRQELEKKLAQFVGSNPVGQRSDAAQTLAEAGSPNPKKQILPALMSLTRDAITLDRVQAARALSFKDQDLSKYGEHRAKFPQSIDERAFGLDLLPPEESKKLVDTMHTKYKNNPKSAEALKFFKSLDLAKSQGFFDQGS
jgi:hypothetical protein